MRTTAQFLALLAFCCGACWFLHHAMFSQATRISGQVINGMTGQPVAYADIQVDRQDFSTTVAKTDARGHFHFVADHAPNLYFLIAGDHGMGNYCKRLYPQATQIGNAQELLLLPGDHRAGSTFI